MTSKTVEIAGVDEHGNSRGRARLINGTWWVSRWDDAEEPSTKVIHESKIVEDIVAAEKLLRDHGATKIFRVERV